MHLIYSISISQYPFYTSMNNYQFFFPTPHIYSKFSSIQIWISKEFFKNSLLFRDLSYFENFLNKISQHQKTAQMWPKNSSKSNKQKKNFHSSNYCCSNTFLWLWQVSSFFFVGMCMHANELRLHLGDKKMFENAFEIYFVVCQLGNCKSIMQEGFWVSCDWTWPAITGCCLGNFQCK